uniref:Envelope glycoprotein n=1 Tax=Aquila chrysaetos chrysaetos TaxID=223781 RepID=A0A663F1P5_AQUCH
MPMWTDTQGEINTLLKNTLAAKKMEYLVARGNRVDERGRGETNNGEKSSNHGMHKQRWMNCLKVGKGVLKLKINTFCFGILIILIIPLSINGNPHEPMKWTISNLQMEEPVQVITTPGKVNFTVSLTKLIIGNRKDKADLCKPIYICPASNFGKGYCNQPGHFYCGYWGCETWASDWNTPGDKHMSIEWMPKGYPENDQWLAGKYWGIRYWEPGPDRGGIFMISKRPLPHDPHPIGPNPILNPVLPTLPNKNHESTQEIPLAVMVHESELQDPLWDMMQTSYLALNSTRPDLTEDCWLCYNVRPPYFEAIGKTSKIRWSNGTNPQECDWGEKNRTRGITLQMVTGQGRCIGKVPINYQPLCNQTISNYAISQHKIQGSKWAIPSGKAKWVCSDIGITPCLSLILFDYEKTFCIQVLIILRIMYHASEEIIQYFEKDRNRQKREPITAITIATILAISGVGTGIASLVKGREIQNLQMAVDEDLERIQKGIDDLAESVHSLSEVVLQNRRGLDLLFLKDGGLCVALREECCSYVDRTGIFNVSPWLTTLFSTLTGPIIMLVLGLTFGPCIIKYLLKTIQDRFDTTKLLLLKTNYIPVETISDEESENYVGEDENSQNSIKCNV